MNFVCAMQGWIFPYKYNDCVSLSGVYFPYQNHLVANRSNMSLWRNFIVSRSPDVTPASVPLASLTQCNLSLCVSFIGLHVKIK